jgi:hypothetical protein
MKAKELGIAVVGSGRIGTLRARLAAKHPAVGFLAVSDKEIRQAKTLADLRRRRLLFDGQQRGGSTAGGHCGVRLDARR